MPISEKIQQAEYGEGRSVLVLFNVVVGVFATALLWAFQITPFAAGLSTNSIQGNLHPEIRQENTISMGTPPGRTLIYSLEPWGGIQIDAAGKSRFAMRDVSILPWRSGDNLLLTTAHMSMVAEFETGIRRRDIRPSVQYIRVRNLNWITTS
ncbi:hypothetical protein [Candidatus Nitrospira allomarina]|uniref:Uncharacterized protein n=1 Tax=Candidatus Nitrospira allomarina TaxID=3020900 RepID=A0AA96G932_9BACT|nr:hypothetical protein [Candidatus Nitrospira allomarina]WNM56662.1 hypothetical protein PP769_11810 [Candidatus Nitrospira allomarina]